MRAPAAGLLLLTALTLAACAPGADATVEAPDPPGDPPTEAASASAADAPTATPPPSLTPAITTTPIPTEGEGKREFVATPLPTDQRNYELCVGLASDSNGYGHVTFQVPDPGTTEAPVVITYITALAVPLQQHLDALGLEYLEVRDHSLSAGGLTIESANYLASGQYGELKRDHCKFVVITPFYPDVAVNLSTPADYIENLEWLVQGITQESPGSRLLVLNYYPTHRADFTVSNSGRGLTPERIAAFNEAIDAACQNTDSIGGVEQVRCIDVRPYFTDLDPAHVLGELTRQDFEAALSRENSYTTIITDYFDRYPEGTITGDGIHLSLAGRDRLAAGLAGVIAEMNGEF